MLAQDFQVDGRRADRLEALKDVAARFVLGGGGLDGRPNDLVGLIAFARFADSVCPLTLDHDHLVGVLEGIDVAGTRAEDGTAIGEAVALAAERLRDALERSGDLPKPRSRAIVLFTDGERFVSMMSQGISGMALGAARGGQGFGAPEADPMREVFEQRSDVGERYLERLRALLTPEQIERLPRTRGQGGARGGFGGGQGGAEGMQGMLERLPEEQRRQLLQAVDRNGNGQIDEDEREGLRQSMRDQFNNVRNGGGEGGRGGRGGRGGGGEA